MSRRRSRGLCLRDVVLLLIVLALGVALYDVAGAGPVILAVVVALVLSVVDGSRRRSRRVSRRR